MRFYHASFNNSCILDKPTLINNMAYFDFDFLQNKAMRVILGCTNYTPCVAVRFFMHF